MEQSTRGSLRLFQVTGIGVYLHWLWFPVAIWQVTMQRPAEAEYSAPIWKAAEYAALFFVILLHEFGHALACRSVGGRADQIVLWPLGGIAFVAPPPRPGAFLWSIVGGPLVNLVLAGPLYGLLVLAAAQGWGTAWPDLARFLAVLNVINLALLVLNLLPVYPLDGGQILHALLWYALGRWESLRVVGVLGMFLGGVLFLGGSLLFLAGAVGGGDGGLGGLVAIVALFMGMRSLMAFRQASAGLALLGLPQHPSCACPACGVAPPKGAFWVCDHCETRFDLFDGRGRCPACGAWYLSPECVHCHQKAPIDRWFDPLAQPPERATDTRETELL